MSDNTTTLPARSPCLNLPELWQIWLRDGSGGLAPRPANL
jgi:hypothetical protein